MIRKAIVLLAVGFLTACGNMTQVLSELEQMTEPVSLVPTELEMSNGLKEALVKGTNIGVDRLATVGGYLDHADVKIPFPQDVIKVANTLRDIGLGSEVDKVVVSLNRAAEDAVTEAAPLFVNAITDMSFQDVKNILFGADNAATQYLQEKTTAALVQAFRPKIENSLDKVNATKYWTDVTTAYNKIPLVKPVNTDLAGYVTTKATNGLFIRIAEEEKAIRENPVERTTALLKKVFNYADSQEE